MRSLKFGIGSILATSIIMMQGCDSHKRNDRKSPNAIIEMTAEKRDEINKAIDSLKQDFISQHKNITVVSSKRLSLENLERDSSINEIELSLELNYWNIQGLYDTVIEAIKSDKGDGKFAIKRYCKLKSIDFADYSSCIISSEASPIYDTILSHSARSEFMEFKDTLMRVTKNAIEYDIKTKTMKVRSIIPNDSTQFILYFINKEFRNKVWKKIHGNWTEANVDSTESHGFLLR